jgi:hypothetical protein
VWAAWDELLLRWHRLVTNPPDFVNLSVKWLSESTRRLTGKKKLSRVNSTSCTEYLAVNGIVNLVEEKPISVYNLESPVITIRGIFILSWILVVLVPFPFLSFFFQSANSGNRSELEKVMLEQLTTPQNLSFAQLNSAFQTTLLIIFAALLLRALAHFLTVAVGLPPKTELKTEI